MIDINLLLTKAYLIKKDIEDWENKGYKINDFTKDIVYSMIQYLETQKRQEKIHNSFRELLK